MKKLTWSVVAALVLGGAGCEWKPMQLTRVSDDKSRTAGEPAAPAAPAPAPAPTPPEGPTPVEQALELSRKLKQASDDLDRARKENKDLIDRNAPLTMQAAQATVELKQARKELDEANAMLREMQTELAKWKADVLGYRDEMRTAQTVQIDALRRVLRLLGAEEIPPAAAAKPPEPIATPAAPAPVAPAATPATRPAAPAAPKTASAPAAPAAATTGARQ
jgi:2-oxoglutarate dehydrogenase E2 component (dihydrolipoamide succinyltransferase)